MSIICISDFYDHSPIATQLLVLATLGKPTQIRNDPISGLWPRQVRQTQYSTILPTVLPTSFANGNTALPTQLLLSLGNFY